METNILREIINRIKNKDLSEEKGMILIRDTLRNKSLMYDKLDSKIPMRMLLNQLGKPPKKIKGYCCRCGDKTQDIMVNGWYMCNTCLNNVIINKDLYFNPDECVFCKLRIKDNEYITYKGILICEKCLTTLKFLSL